jgi:hypothetical protein
MTKTPDPLVEEYHALSLARVRSLVRADQPLVLVQDEGLVTALQGHPECHVLPYPLDAEPPLGKNNAWEAINGVLGFDRSRARFGTVLAELQRTIYERELNGRTKQRAALNAYFTSFFNAWVDNQSLYGLTEKRWVVAHAASQPAWFAKTYPGGHFVEAGTTLESLCATLGIDADAPRRTPVERRGPLPPGPDEYARFCEQRVEDRAAVDQPVVLITQAPRSGGTLLLRLFDGHPEVHSIPYEFITNFEPAERKDLHEALVARKYDGYIDQFFRKGYSQSRIDLHGDDARYPMLTPPLLHRRLFDACVADAGSDNWRHVTSCFFTAYFNGWLDNQNAAGDKKWVVMFTPRFSSRGDKIKQFWTLYPEGKVISVVRDPLSWFASARRWSKTGEWSEREKAVAAWRRAVKGILRLRTKHPEQALVVSFEDLLARTEPLMGRLAERLGIDFAPELLTPTFNRMPVRPNSSFSTEATEVVAAPLGRRAELSEAEARYVRERTWDLYEAALELAEPIARPQRRPSKAPSASSSSS